MLNKNRLRLARSSHWRTILFLLEGEAVCCVFREHGERAGPRRRSVTDCVPNIYLQYQACIDMDDIMTRWDIPCYCGELAPLVFICSPSLLPTHPIYANMPCFIRGL